MKCRYNQRIARLEAARNNALEALSIHRESIRALWVSHTLPLPGEPMNERAEQGLVNRAAARELACEQITAVRAIDDVLKRAKAVGVVPDNGTDPGSDGFCKNPGLP